MPDSSPKSSRTEFWCQREDVPSQAVRDELAYWLNLPEITAVEWMRWGYGYQADLERMRAQQATERGHWAELRAESWEWN